MKELIEGDKVEILKNINGIFEKHDTGIITNINMHYIINILHKEELISLFFISGLKQKYQIAIRKFEVGEYIMSPLTNNEEKKL